MAGAEDIWKYYFILFFFLSQTKDRVTYGVVGPCTPVKQQFPDLCKMLGLMVWSHVATTITSISRTSKKLVVDFHASNMDNARMGQMDENPKNITASADI